MKDNEYKHNYKLTIAYDGTDFNGWQVQPNAVTIQELLEKYIKTVIREEVHLVGSGRTDAGVHAHGQVANFRCHTPLEIRKFHASMNGLLPKDIRILNVEEVPMEFHSRYSASSKCYHYHLYTERVQLPFQRRYSWHLKQPIDTSLLKQAATLFIGEHNFTSFANEAHAGSAAKNPVRNLYRLDVIEETHGVRLEFEANGFLYKMVRNIVGTLQEVASGKRSIDEIPQIFEGLDRRMAGKAAPPTGLFLQYVNYPDNATKMT
ncbi:MAG: tRNA pseudouridine(38-40) synthase TruA [Chlamydiota bacterium]|nr:tRNA pseudouridine(38-40) synthase TruA [Chlamydiota bacterium]